MQKACHCFYPISFSRFSSYSNSVDTDFGKEREVVLSGVEVHI